VQTRPLLSIAIRFDPPAELGSFLDGERRLVAFRSGVFEGADGLRGTLADGGVDWQTVRSDGVVEVRARYLLLTDDGEPIEVRSEGIRVATPGVWARLGVGAPVDADEYYFRSHVHLSTSAPRWSRLNAIVAVASGERRPDDEVTHVHELL
jgi:hypothetical protein